MTSPSRAAPLPALTGARFFAAFAVVVVHYGSGFVAAFVPALQSTAAAGPAAVSFFYVLSGAVLTWGSTTPEGAPLRPARTFWTQRVARIAPAYLFALLLSLGPFLHQLFALHDGAAGMLRAIVVLAACVFAVQSFVPQLSTGLNTPGWSISCEAFFYAAWPRLVVWLKDARPGFPWRRCAILWIPTLLPTLLGVAWVALAGAPEGPFRTALEPVAGEEMLRRTLTYFPPLRLAEFAMGVVLGHSLRKTALGALERGGGWVRDTLRELGLLLALFAAATALGGGLAGRLTGVDPLATRLSVESGILSPLFALLVWQLARGQGLLQRFLSRAPLLALGEASYGLYILQEPVLVWFSAALKRGLPFLASRWELGFVLYALLLVVLSLLTHRFIEIPVRKALLARWARRPAAAQVA